MLLKSSIEVMSLHMSSRSCSSFHMSFFGSTKVATYSDEACPVARLDAIIGNTVYGNVLVYYVYTIPHIDPYSICTVW